MDILQKNLEFYNTFKGKKGFIGSSLMGEKIPFYLIEKSKHPTLIVQYSMHAREYITSYLALRQIEYFEKYSQVGRVFFLPLLNPDGVKICLDGKPLYKANARGVDLNVNFDARWGSGAQNVHVKGDENFIGEFPFSEPESLALKNFTLCVRPDFTVSYHSKGREIYYEFFQPPLVKQRDCVLAKRAAEVTGYQIKATPFSAGGYKDWCIETLKIPALTIEVGDDSFSHPLGEESLGEIYKENKNLIIALCEAYNGELNAK